MKRNALIVLERPWNIHTKDQNTASVLPFFQGLQKLNNNFDLFHTNFYEAESFELALEELTQLDYDRYYLYIACHGAGRRLENINLSNALGIINMKAQERNIVGVLIGSCLVGKNVYDFEAFTESSSIVWKAGYKCSVDWLDGTILDVKIFDEMIQARSNEFESREKVISRFTNALETYNPDASIGWDEKEQPMAIKDSLSLVVQPKGRGNRALDCSERLFEAEKV